MAGLEPWTSDVGCDQLCHSHYPIKPFLQHPIAKYFFLSFEISVTRWLDYFFNICPSATKIICPILKLDAKVGLNFAK